MSKNIKLSKSIRLHRRDIPKVVSPSLYDYVYLNDKISNQPDTLTLFK